MSGRERALRGTIDALVALMKCKGAQAALDELEPVEAFIPAFGRAVHHLRGAEIAEVKSLLDRVQDASFALIDFLSGRANSTSSSPR